MEVRDHGSGTFDSLLRMPSLDHILSTLPAAPHIRGRAFERLCAWYLLHDPVYAAQVKRVWLWNEWPGRWGPDAGIDLVAETHDGALWAVQAKCYAPTTRVTKADIDSFLSESNRKEIAFRLLIATTDGIAPNARHVTRGQEKPASLLLLSDLLASTVQWPQALDGPDPAPRAALTPRPHQTEALRAIATVPLGGRGRVIMACGTGKTLVQLWAHEQRRSHRTLVLVPSLFLVAQVMREWTANRSRAFEFLAVCSDESVVGKEDDSFVADVSEIGVPVTTDPEQIRRFLAGDGDRVVFSTYQSSGRVADAVAGTATRFDLVLADEAHQLAGSASRDFAAILDDERIPADRRLFFTATPRYFTGRQARQGGETDLDVASMDDEARFGPEVHRLSFGEAIRRELLSDYRVVVVGVTDRQVYELASEGAFVGFAGKATDARALARQLGLAKAMHDYGLHRVISFHSRVAAAKAFAEDLSGVIGRLPAERAPAGRLLFDHVSGAMATGERRTRLGRLRNIEADQYALLANARCLSEGVDVPAIDGVAFIDPRRSQVDIVQAVGRAIRLSANKTLGTIVIPVLVAEGESDEAVLDGSAFAPVWAVVRALRDHDEELAEQLDAARRKLGREGRLTQDDLPAKLVIDVPVGDVGDGFADAIVTRIVRSASSPWEEGFAHLVEYVGERRDSKVPALYRTASGYRLGNWVIHQRFERQSLNPRRASRLAALPGWVWDVNEAAWEAGFVALEEYVNVVGDAPPRSFVSTAGFRLGDWVKEQRGKRAALAPERASRLEALAGWSWDPFEAAWEEGFARLSLYLDREGRPPVGSFRTHDGYRLGSWVTVQRQKRSTIRPERASRLEALAGWSWEVPDDRWESGFEQLRRHVAAGGDARPPARFVTDTGFQLEKWVKRQRAGRVSMSAECASRLESLPGWVWSANDAGWEEGFAALQSFAARHGHASPNHREAVGGIPLGRWVIWQRTQRAQLCAERSGRLEALSGWRWNSWDTAWERGFAELQNHVFSSGTAALPALFTTDAGFRLGGWVREQRSRRNALGPDRIARLEALSGWVWHAGRPSEGPQKE